MKKFLIVCAVLLMSNLTSFGQVPDNVQEIKATPNKVTTYSDNLKNGFKMADLDWADNSSVACFPGTQNSKFRGNHRLHMFEIPKYSEVTVKLIPKDKSANFSLYGYQVGTTNYSTPPNLSSCVSCEADHKWDYPKKGKTQDHTRSIWFNSTTNSYNIFVGVTGPEGLTEGDYTIEIDLKSRVENTDAQQPLKKYGFEVEVGKKLSYSGDLKDGCKIIDLSWAASSSNACWPATQNLKFNGNHIFFVTELPRYADMEIKLIPSDPKQNMSLYAYQDGTTSNAYPPELARCVSCEADHKWDRPKKGKTQDHTRTVKLNSINNPYRVVIGIAGAEGLTSGSFIIEVTVRSKK